MLTIIGDILNWAGLILAPLALAPLIYLATGAALAGRVAGAIAGAADAVNQRLASGVIWLALAMAATQFALVILRYVFGVSNIAVQESVIYMHAALFLLTAGYALKTDDHVRVDLFYREASPRARAIIDLSGFYLFLGPICILAIWMAGPYVASSWAVREGSNEASGLPAIFLLKSMIPAFAALLFAQGVAAAARAAFTLRGDELRETPHRDGAPAA